MMAAVTAGADARLRASQRSSLDPGVRETGGYGLGMNTATRGLTTRPAYPT
jgi:hypothetical protein